MTETFKHKCIKPSCSNTYEDNDPDPYYCSACIEVKKAIAEKIDKQFAGIPKIPVESELQKYDRLKDERGFVNYKLL